MTPVSVIVADDHPIVLKGLVGLLAEDSAVSVLAACTDGGSARDAIVVHKPDIALLDVRMPVLTGPEVLGAIRKLGLRTRVIFLTASASDSEVLVAIAGGAHAVMLKDMAPDDLIDCLHLVAGGGRWFPRAIVDRSLNAEAEHPVEWEAACSSLTAREREVSALVATGLSNKEIARRLDVSDGTVKLHLHNIYGKAGVKNRTALAALTLTYRELFEVA